MLEYVDHLHEHFVDPVRLKGGRYITPTSPGHSIAMKRESLEMYHPRMVQHGAGAILADPYDLERARPSLSAGCPT